MQRHGYLVFDMHHHIGVRDLNRSPEEVDRDLARDYEMRVGMMDRHSIRQAAIHPSARYLKARGYEDTKALNDALARYRQRYKERFPVVLGILEPQCGEKLGLAEAERCIGELKLDGFSWHHAHTASEIYSPFMVAMMRKVRELRVPAFIHVGAGHLEEDDWGVEALAEEFPDVTIVALDALSDDIRAERMTRLARRHRNVWLETGLVRPIKRWVDTAVERVGADQVIFGTDLVISQGRMHYNSPHPLYEILDSATISDQDKRKVFWGNAQRLFKLPA